MLSLYAIALVVAAPPPDWIFRDDLMRDGRLMVVFQTVELGTAPPRPLHADDKTPAGAKYGDLRLGSGGSLRRAVARDRASPNSSTPPFGPPSTGRGRRGA